MYRMKYEKLLGQTLHLINKSTKDKFLAEVVDYNDCKNGLILEIVGMKSKDRYIDLRFSNNWTLEEGFV